MNGETIITAENIGMAAEVICAELPNPIVEHYVSAIDYDDHPLGWNTIRLREYAYRWALNRFTEAVNRPPTLAELRDEVRERFAEYIQQEDGR